MQLQALLVSSALLTGSALVEAWSPSNGYAPSLVTCDDNINLIREADTLSQNETDWLTKRNVYTQEALQSFLDRATSNFSDNSLLSSLFTSGNGSTVPKIGVACSGGGYRAMLSGAGMLAAMDNRTDGANDHGLGGLLQSTTYLAGLSGGSWLVGSLAWNNWTSVQDILNNMSQNDSIWDITNSLASPGGTNSTASTERWADIVQAVASKEEAGFSITLADYWGRALAYNFFPSLPDGGVGYTWSSLRDADVFKNGEMPFPISVADFRHPNTVITNTNSTIFEFNPFEIGSWDDSLNAFSDVKYLGTEVSNGVPTTQGQCVEGFDNTGFIVGTSSTLFSPAMQPVIGLLLNNASVATIFEKAIGNDSNDVANYAPNPFKNANFATEKSETTVLDSDYLYLADGGEDSEGIPFTSLIQKDRDLDVIFALDNSADTSASWPAGLSLISTYERQFSAQGKGIAFPYVPDEATFLQLGLNNKPTFFGCDANNLTDLQYIPPLVVYIPNARHSFNSNQSTLKLSYTEPERFSMIQNGFEATTRGNFTEDPEFLGCVACAIIRRKQQSLNATLPEECESCFTNYCWNGTFSDSVSIVSNSSSSASSSSTNIASSSTSTLSPTSISSGASSTTTSTLTSSISVENGAATIYHAIYNPRYIINILCMIAIFSILV